MAHTMDAMRIPYVRWYFRELRWGLIGGVLVKLPAPENIQWALSVFVITEIFVRVWDWVAAQLDPTKPSVWTPARYCPARWWGREILGWKATVIQTLAFLALMGWLWYVSEG